MRIDPQNWGIYNEIVKVKGTHVYEVRVVVDLLLYLIEEETFIGSDTRKMGKVILWRQI